ncbi:TVP38/TMEM64 family protein [Metabacillus iocasae]|uniref:TVP38/TMEM64 family membrane protein n=1 Tax=Priestia iocasae TaxID=2291674 RepID=A0ABS2QQ05_9BACI|nr:TVP38/TMEM64 family protein [Metabacillus iocasae]MBM7701298.1 putative membrane protein YdjX (TVP38/TMEM64 family) [Metabacillus iocasae]
MNKLNKKVKVGLILLVVGIIIWFSRSYLNFDTNQIRDWILSFGILSPVVYIIVYTIRPLIFFPASILSIAGGLAFGSLFGTLYTIIGATSGAVVSFIVARKLGKNIGGDKREGNVKKIQQQMEKNGFLYVLLFRLLPILNFDLVSYLAGVSRVRFVSFFLGTLIGIIPGTFAYNFLGSSIISGDPTIIIIAIIVFILLTAIPILIKNRFSKSSN